jgi:hypothetical protein
MRLLNFTLLKSCVEKHERELVQMRWGLIPTGIKPEAHKRMSTSTRKHRTSPAASGRGRSASITAWSPPRASSNRRKV